MEYVGARVEVPQEPSLNGVLCLAAPGTAGRAGKRIPGYPAGQIAPAATATAVNTSPLGRGLAISTSSPTTGMLLLSVVDSAVEIAPATQPSFPTRQVAVGSPYH